MTATSTPIEAASVAHPPRNYLSCLQAYRGLAALAILLFHVAKLFKVKLGISLACAPFFRKGFLGVDFFFVLSGFIILYTNARSIGNPPAAKRFFYQRLTRIYPVFLSVCLLKLIFMFAGGGVSEGKMDFSRILASLLLLPQPDLPLLDVAWPLSFEMAFYLLFLFLIVWGATLWRAVMLHALLVVLVNLPGLPLLEFPASFMFSPFFLEFYLGCLACHLVVRRPWSFRVASSTFLAGFILVVVGYLGYSDFLPGIHPHGELFRAIFWGTACSLLLFGSVALGPNFDRYTPWVLKTLGDASYSVYLMHGTLINLCLSFLAARATGPLHHVGWFALAIGSLALIGGYTYYLLVEKPLLNFCRRHAPR
jgi:exopolysaccharide production protein ExoZ